MINRQFELQRDVEPLDGQLYMQRSVHELVDNGYLEAINGMLRFRSQDLPIVSAAGRNYHVPLPEPVGDYDCLQVAGGGNLDLGVRTNDGIPHGIVAVPFTEGQAQVIEPPSSELFTSYTTYYENGGLVDKTNANPVGSYTERSASRKIANTLAAAEHMRSAGYEVLAPIYAGKFVYDVPDQNGENQTAMLLLVPSMGQRFESTLLSPITSLASGYEVPEFFEESLGAYYQQVLGDKFQRIGQAIAVLHTQGLNHNQPTPGNVAILDYEDGTSTPYVTDWDTMTIPTSSDAEMARALDVSIALATNVSMPLWAFENKAIGKDATVSALGFTACHLLSGYLTRMGQRSLPGLRLDDILYVMAQDDDSVGRLERVARWISSTRSD